MKSFRIRRFPESFLSKGRGDHVGEGLCIKRDSAFKNHLRTMTNYPFYFATPEPCKNKMDRKPYPTPMKDLIRKSKELKKFAKENPCRMLEEPPDNGLLVPELIPVANEVYQAWKSLLLGLSHIIKFIPVKRCRFCPEIHVGHIGHEITTCTGRNRDLRNGLHIWKNGQVHDVLSSPYCFHLSDRVRKPRVGESNLSNTHRLPSIVELCIQAGLDLHNYPTKRRTKPLYSVDGNITDFEPKFESRKTFHKPTTTDSENPEFERSRELVDAMLKTSEEEKQRMILKELGEIMLCSWEDVLGGCRKLMAKYKVHTCGYCPEVQVGPKGHRVMTCRAHKFWSRDGLHTWQEAAIDDVIPCSYVWHVGDSNRAPLSNGVKRYYRKVPAVVELCGRIGAPISKVYQNMLLFDVVVPDRDEVDLVA